MLNTTSVSIRGTKAAEWDRNTWAPLEDLAQNHPEAGIHFQGMLENAPFSHSNLTRAKSARYSVVRKIKDPPPQSGSLSYCHQVRGSRISFRM